MSSSAVDMYLRRFSRAGGSAASVLSAVSSSSTRKYCTENPCSTARMPRPTSKWVFPTPDVGDDVVPDFRPEGAVAARGRDHILLAVNGVAHWRGLPARGQPVFPQWVAIRHVIG